MTICIFSAFGAEQAHTLVMYIKLTNLFKLQFLNSFSPNWVDFRQQILMTKIAQILTKIFRRLFLKSLDPQ